MKNKSLLMTMAILIIAMSSVAQVTGTFTDPRDGKVYKTVTIGTQTWMAENLKATKYNDGTAIPLAKVDPEWPSNRTPGYCWYDNDEAKYKNTYGALYNQFTVDNDKLCPIGWSVPGKEEWEILEEFLYNDNDEDDMEGGRLKEAGTTHWATPNTGATDSSGFTALPGGGRNNDGAFGEIGYSAYFWSTEGYSPIEGIAYGISHDNSSITQFPDDKVKCFSVRCVRDN
jgi:uncharacterized protein (TIGR02145 family)